MVNSSIAKITGSVSPCDGKSLDKGTKAAKRSLKNGSVEGNYFLEGCSMYGTEGVGSMKGAGGGSSSLHKSSMASS